VTDRPLPRTYLYVPGDKPEMLAKSLDRGADAVIADLEDAVPAPAKAEAREVVASFVTENRDRDVEIWVRINGIPDLLEEDLAAIADLPGLAGVVVAKADSPELLAMVPPHLNIQPLIESARAVLALGEIASVPGVQRLQIGEADLSADLGASFGHADEVMGPVRMQVVVASAAAGLMAPVAPVTTNFRDLEAFERSTLQLRRQGYGARAVIHPAQVEVANRVFTPSDKEVAAARRLLETAAAGDTGVFLDENGRMVDEAVLRSARRLTALARAEKSDD
jgi:citrate lyase subunit beta/citryl-CoA lyase